MCAQTKILDVITLPQLFITKSVQLFQEIIVTFVDTLAGGGQSRTLKDKIANQNTRTQNYGKN
jgi:hypothetical protein